MMLKSLTGKFLFQLEVYFSKPLLCSFKITSKYIFVTSPLEHIFRAYSKTTPRLQITVLNVYAFLSWTVIILISTLICYIWLFFSEAGPSCSGSIYSRRIVYVHIPFHTVQHEGIHHGPICFPFVWS